MALETLKDIKKIGDFNVRVLKLTNMDWYEPIGIDHTQNIIAFKIQNGPVKENKQNGCQVDTIIEAVELILEGLNDQKLSIHNLAAINLLRKARLKLAYRTADRITRGVDGTSKD